MITVKAEKYRDAREDAIYEGVRRKYRDITGLSMVEDCSRSGISDFCEGSMRRFSEDNGKTWTEWEIIKEEDSSYDNMGEHDRNFPFHPDEHWNPVHKHWVGPGMERIFKGGHEKALRQIWTEGGPSPLSDHVYFRIRHPDGKSFYQMVKYEDGTEFNRDDPLNPEYFYKNNSYEGNNLIFDDNGDFFQPVIVSTVKCCEMLGIDPEDVCPSHVGGSLIVVHGVWNGEKYDLHYSRPAVISDLFSSRGVMEPSIAKLKSGRLLVVFRVSNYQNAAWGTRIENGTPSFKWYTYSDDGGKTFVNPMPWHYDDGEVIYSSSSIGHLVRSEKNGKLYWIGNITGHEIRGNDPRWPLQIVEVDETYGTAKKETCTLIDTRREGEGVNLELSNFAIHQNRETGDIELFLTKRKQFPEGPWQKSEVWHYAISLPD